jgi:hypothetical protein
MALMSNGCAITKLPSNNDLVDIEEGKKSMVILRFIWEMHGEPYEPFPSRDITKNISASVGGSRTGGKTFIDYTQQYFLSSETRKQGWTYLLLEPGTYYFSFRLPTDEHFYSAYQRNAPRWRFEIAEGVRSLYIGSFYLKTIHGGKKIRNAHLSEVNLLNEQELAEKTIKEVLPNMVPLQCSIMQKYDGGPIYLRTPSSKNLKIKEGYPKNNLSP